MTAGDAPGGRGRADGGEHRRPDGGEHRRPDGSERDVPVRVVCETISAFDNRSFREGTKFRNAILAPTELLSELDVDPFGYVRASPAAVTAEGVTEEVIQVVPFSDDHVADEHLVEGHHKVCIRTNLQRAIGLEEAERNPLVRLRPHAEFELKELQVRRPTSWQHEHWDATEGGSICHLHADDFETLGVDEGEEVEVLNPQTGSRILLPAREFKRAPYGEGNIRLDGHTRDLLGVESTDEHDKKQGDEVWVRVPDVVPDSPLNRRVRRRLVSAWRRATDRVGQWFVDYNVMQLHILPDHDRDEDRNVVRAGEDVLSLLAVEPGDRLLVEWRDERRSVRCLRPLPDDDLDGLSLRVPSSERDRLNISVGDAAFVRRDMGYVMGKRVTLSVFGILGVVIGAQQVIGVFFPAAGLSLLAVVVLVLSVLTVWFVLWPERQRCRNPL